MASPIDQFLHDAPYGRANLEQRLASCADLGQVAWVLCEFAGRELGLDDCVVYLTERGGRAVVQRAAWGAKRVSDRMFEGSIRLVLGQGIVGTCALIGAPQVVPDTRLDQRYVVDDVRRLSELAVPMLSGDEVLGVIDCEHADADHFDSRHIRALLSVADAGVARLRELAL